MHLTELRIRNFRCLEAADLQPAPGINLIVGANASGKSSLLESIHYLGRAQSFRSTAPDRLVRHHSGELSVFGRLSDGAIEQTIGIARNARQTRIKIGNEEGGTILQLVETLPVQVIDPQLHQLLEDGPDQRRRFLDWGVFHVEQSFYPAWLRYQRALRQRNRALREASPQEVITAWDGEIIQQAGIIDELRIRYLDDLRNVATRILERLFGDKEIEVEYNPGWQRDIGLQEALGNGLMRDMEAGYTQAGPHRADLRIRMSGRQARTQASRGEQKLLSAGLLLAQAQLLQQRKQRRPLLLIDDLAAELDAHGRLALFQQIAALGTQCFLSFLEASAIPKGDHGATMFHVEHGVISRKPA